MNNKDLDLTSFIDHILQEDIREGDHTSLACIPATAMGKARLLVKGDGILAGVELAKQIFARVDENLQLEVLIEDGAEVTFGEVAFFVEGRKQSILTAERVVLNCMQRMSGIATMTHRYVSELKGLNTKVLDTRKTTPGFRAIEKWAVRIGGGTNHRMGLYDMLMIKDNHHDFCGGITNAVLTARQYLKDNHLEHLQIELEVRNMDELHEALKVGQIDRIMLDNFNVATTQKAVELVGGRVPLESSGGITLKTIRGYAEAGVDYVSVGALTHSYDSLDLSLKAV